MKLNKARNKIDPAYTEVAVFGHEKGKEHLRFPAGGRAAAISGSMWLTRPLPVVQG